MSDDLVTVGYPVYLGLIHDIRRHVRLNFRHRWRLTQTVSVLYYCWFHDVHIEPCIRVALTSLRGLRWCSLYRTIMELLCHSHADIFRFAKYGIVYHHVIIRRPQCLTLRVHIHQAVASHVWTLLLIYLRGDVLSVATATLDYRLGDKISYSRGVVTRRHWNLVIWFRLDGKLEDLYWDDTGRIRSAITTIGSHVQVVQLLLG